MGDIVKEKNKISIYMIVIFTIVFAIITYSVISGDCDNFNLSFASFVQSFQRDFFTKFAIFISTISDWTGYVPVCIILLIIPKTRIKYGLPGSLLLSFSALSNQILKRIFQVPRPDVNRLVEVSASYGYPSGHSMNAMAFIGFMSFLICRNIKSTAMKALVYTVSALFILTVGVSRIYLGVHNPTDVLGGFAFGIVMINIGIIVYEKYETKLNKMSF